MSAGKPVMFDEHATFEPSVLRENEAVDDTKATDTRPAELRSPRRSANRFKSCVLHIGTEKTGTKALQQFCALNRKALRKQGAYYPKIGSNGSQWELAAAVHDTPWRNDDLRREFGVECSDSQERFRDALYSTLDREFSKVGQCDRLVMSSEHLHSRLQTTSSLSRLKEFLEAWADEVQVVVYFRRQDRVAVSLGSTRVKSGLAEDVGVFPRAEVKSLPYFNYDKIYRNWSNVFGADAVTVRLFDEVATTDTGLMKDFSGLLDVSVDGLKMPEKKMNASLSRPAFYFLQEVNRQLPKFQGGKMEPSADLIARIVATQFQGKHFPASRSDAREFAERFAEGNERLRAAAFPDRDLPLFDDDFSEYPDEAEACGLSPEEAVSIAIELVRQVRVHEERPGFLAGLARRLFRAS